MNKQEAGTLQCPNYATYCHTVNCRAWMVIDEENGCCPFCDPIEFEYYRAQYLSAGASDNHEEEGELEPYRTVVKVDNYGNVEDIKGGSSESSLLRFFEFKD